MWSQCILLSLIIPTQAAPADSLCGIRCLYICDCALRDNTRTFEEFQRQYGATRLLPASLNTLRETAESIGLKALPVKTTISRLQYRRRSGERFLFIAHVFQNHFVIVFDGSEANVSFVDFPMKKTVPIATFGTIWDGTGLILSANELVDESMLRLPTDWMIVIRKWLIPTLFSAAIALGLLVYSQRKRTRRSLSLGLVVLSAFTSGGCGPSTKGPTNAALLVIEPSKIDLGELQISKEPVLVVTKIINRGSQSARLSHVEMSCRCAEAKLAAEAIKPGEERELTVAVSLDVARRGMQGASATVFFAEPRISKLFVVQWSSFKICDLDKDEIDFVVQKEIDRAEETVDLLSTHLERDTVDVRCRSMHEGLDCKMVPLSVAGRLASIKVRLKSASKEGLNVGYISCEVLRKTDQVILFRHMLPVRWTFAPEFSVFPKDLSFGQVSDLKDAVERVLVRSNDERAFKIRSVRTDLEFMQPEWDRSRTSTTHTIALRPIAATPGKHFVGRVKVGLSDSKSTELSIGISGSFP